MKGWDLGWFALSENQLCNVYIYRIATWEAYAKLYVEVLCYSLVIDSDNVANTIIINKEQVAELGELQQVVLAFLVFVYILTF